MTVRKNTRIESSKDRGNDGRTQVVIHSHLGGLRAIDPPLVLAKGPMDGVELEGVGAAFLAIDGEAGAARGGFLQGGDAEAVELAVCEGVDGLDTDGDWRGGEGEKRME